MITITTGVEDRAMKALEDEIEELEALDQVRIQSAELRDQGRKALRASGLTWARESSMDDALVVKALCDRRDGPPKDRVASLERFQRAAGQPDLLPILRAARSMQALAAAPDSAFSEALLHYYYQIIRELYTADTPDWQFGGARASTGRGRASAFVTGECVRAILGFSRTLNNTGTFVRELRSYCQRKDRLANDGYPGSWRAIEWERLKVDFCTTVAPLLDNLALKLELPPATSGLSLTIQTVDTFIETAPERIKQAVRKVVTSFDATLVTVHRQRKEERRDARRERSRTGHVVACNALARGKVAAEEAASLQLANAATLPDELAKLAERFSRVAKEVRRIIEPARIYLATVLDRELTAAASRARPRWDPAEMAFAAASYGFASGRFDDDRLRRAGVCLSEELSERGLFRTGSPFHTAADGTEFGISGANVLGALAQLLENVEEIPLDARLARRMLRYFSDAKKPFRGEGAHHGWCEQDHPDPVLRDTALSVISLDRVNRMLDARINQRVFRHFSVKRTIALKVPKLKELFYPDYGLRRNASVLNSEGYWKEEEPIALVLERLRTHVLGLSRRERAEAPLFSLILYGPPGTGKTTLAEALAKSADVPLVEITPSDIVSAGADVVERRARVVFKALALLTRVVIMFDEFDPILRRRNPKEAQPTVFSFVTPGMFPKLKSLHEQAKRRGVAYVLVTNLIGALDGAAIRPGRFDCKLGVFPPDPLSREGRLLNEALEFRHACRAIPELDERYRDRWQDLAHRVRSVVQKTGGAQIDELTREGWFRRPADPREMPANSPFIYITGETDTLPEIESTEGPPKSAPGQDPQADQQPTSNREAPAPDESDSESERNAVRERRQRAWLQAWEQQVREAPQDVLWDAIEKPPHEIPPDPRSPS
jgi:chloramphenicol 3-O-phosphotransferase